MASDIEMHSPEGPEDFPHLHHVKAIGRHPDLLGAVRSAVSPFAPGLPEDAFTLRPSRQGQYVAVTCTVEVDSPGQLQAIYGAVQEIEGVLLCL